MSALRSVLILLLAGGSVSAVAEQITCESNPHSGPQACGTIQPGSSVRLVRQLDGTTCVEGRTWGTGAGHDSLWVSQGCRAVFDVQAHADRAAASAPGMAPGDRYDSTRRPERDARADDPYAGSRDERLSQRARDEDEDSGGDARGDEDRADEDGIDEDRAGDDRVREDRAGDRDQDRYARNEPYDDDADDADSGDDEPPRARGRYGPRVAGGGVRAAARRACIDEAVAGRPFGPDDVTATAVRRGANGMLVVELDTPDGDVMCTADPHGNVRSIDR